MTPASPRLDHGIELALYQALEETQRRGLPLSDDAWLLACLSQDAHCPLGGFCSLNGKALKLLGLQERKAWVKQQWQALEAASPERSVPSLVQQGVQALLKGVFGTLFLDPPGVRPALEAFLNRSSLYVEALNLAIKGSHGVEAPKVSWIDFYQAGQGLQLASLQSAQFPADWQAYEAQLYTHNTRRQLLYVAKEAFVLVLQLSLMLMAIRQFVGEPRLIPSESMLPTLQVEDRIWIDKIGGLLHRPWQRGDILVFYPPTTELKGDPLSLYFRWTGLSGFLPKEMNIDVAYIKRVVAVAGDTVNVVPNDGVYINGKKAEEPFVNEIAESCTKMQGEFPLSCEPYTVPAGHVFMMGDNRNESFDSRWWGPLPMDRIIGRATFRLWPTTRLGSVVER